MENGEHGTGADRLERHKMRLISSGWEWLKHRDPKTVALFLLIFVAGPGALWVAVKEFREIQLGYFHALAFERADCAKQREADRAMYSKWKEDDRAFIREIVERFEKRLDGK